MGTALVVTLAGVCALAMGRIVVGLFSNVNQGSRILQGIDCVLAGFGNLLMVAGSVSAVAVVFLVCGGACLLP